MFLHWPAWHGRESRVTYLLRQSKTCRLQFQKTLLQKPKYKSMSSYSMSASVRDRWQVQIFPFRRQSARDLKG